MSVDNFLEMIMNFGNNEAVRALMTYAQGLFIAIGAKIVFFNNKEGKNLVTRVSTILASVTNIVKEGKSTKDEILELRKELKDAKQTIKTDDEKFDMLSEMFSDFVSATNIPIEHKIKIAKKFDMFKELNLHGQIKEDVVEVVDTVQEMLKTSQDLKEAKTKKISSYADALKSVVTDDEQNKL